MRQLVIVLLSLAVLFLPGESSAVFHFSHISEVMSGAAMDPTTQYVEIRMDIGLQSAVMNSVLSAWDCTGNRSELLVVPTTVMNQGPGVTWLIATKTPVGGITPDFTWDTVDGNIDPACGQVCWGAPGQVVPAVGTWDHEMPNNYVDCVAYGPYTGPTKTADPDPDGINSSDGTPTTLTPGGGMFSLARVQSHNNNSTDFAYDCPSPKNNAGQTGTFGPCTPPSTTSTTTTTTLAGATTTTSLPAACTDVASCRNALAGTLPSAASAANGKARKVAVKIGKLFKTAENALDKAGSATGKKHDKQVRKVRTTLGKLIKKAQAAEKAGTLGVSLDALTNAVNALLAALV